MSWSCLLSTPQGTACIYMKVTPHTAAHAHMCAASAHYTLHYGIYTEALSGCRFSLLAARFSLLATMLIRTARPHQHALSAVRKPSPTACSYSVPYGKQLFSSSPIQAR